MWVDSAVAWLAEAANALAAAQLFAALVTAAATFALWRVTRVLSVETKTLAAMTSRRWFPDRMRAGFLAAPFHSARIPRR